MLSPFAGSWFWSPSLASVTPVTVRLSPLLTVFFLRLPFNQLKACPRELPGFLLPRWALACLANISVTSLGTRSPVDLLRDILEVGPGSSSLVPPLKSIWVFCQKQDTESPLPLEGFDQPLLSLSGLAQCLCWCCLSPPGTTMRSADSDSVRWKNRKKGDN